MLCLLDAGLLGNEKNNHVKPVRSSIQSRGLKSLSVENIICCKTVPLRDYVTKSKQEQEQEQA
jgi:hypothetical protein